MVRAMCGVQLKDRKISTDLMFILALNETMDQLLIVNSVHWYGHVLKRKDGHVLRRALDVEFGGHRKREWWQRKRMWRMEEEGGMVGLSMMLCQSR